MSDIQNVSFYNPPEINLLKQKLSTIPISTKDLTALSNNTYVYDTPFQIKSRKMNTGTREAETTGIITFPSSPADGDFITLVDSANVFGGEVDTYSYSTVVMTINFNGKVCKGDCTDGSLLPARKGQVTFKFSTSSNHWTGFLLKPDDITSDDPWTGYWTPITYAAYPFDVENDSKNANGQTVRNTAYCNSYIYLDATKNPVQQYFYEGTPNKPYNSQSTINKSRIPLISVTGTNVMPYVSGNYTGTLPLQALVKFNDPTFGINQPDQWDISNYSRYVLEPTDPNQMYLYNTRADIYHSYGGDQNIVIYKKMSTPIPYVKSQVSDDQQVYSFGDPVVLFDWYCDMMTKNCNPNNNSCQNPSFYGDSYKIKSFIESVKKDGFSVTTPIKSIVVSSAWETIFNTQENCHYCPPGSNITISGFSGAYAVLNGYHENNLNPEHNYFGNYMNSGTMDYNLTNGIATGSVMDHMNIFDLNYDSSSLPYSTGPNALYGQAIFEGNPVVTVLHKVHSEMTYNEWIAACAAVKQKIHGPQTHSYIQGVWNRNTYKVQSNWSEDPFLGDPGLVFLNTRGRDCPSHNYVDNYGGYYDPYKAQPRLDYYISIDSKLKYGGYVKQYSGINPLIIRNYLQTGTVSNLWYAMDKPYTGPYADTFQPLYSNVIGSKNLSNPSLVGGSQFVCEMKPYPYSTVSALPDLNTWNLNSSSNNNGYIGSTGVSNTGGQLSGVYNGINECYCGLIRPDLVTSLGYGSKKVAYLRITGFDFFNDHPNKYNYNGLNVFNTPVTGAYQHTGALGQLYFSSVISKYINDLGADALILDDRNGGGGYQPQMFFPFFGGDRLGVTHATPLNDDGYGPLTNLQTSPDIVNSNQLYSDFSAGILPTEMERLFPGSVFKGTTGSPKKIVILHDMNAASGNDVWIHGWLGDNYDGNIGGNVTCSFLGDSDGRLLGGYGPGGSLPVDYNSKVNTGLAYYTSVSSESSASFIKHLATGPVSGDVYYHNIYPETSIRGMSAGATGTLTSVSGNKCFPNSYESTIYQDWGYIPPQPSAVARWIPSTRPVPTPDNLYSYRDAWLENAIREALYLPSV